MKGLTALVLILLSVGALIGFKNLTQDKFVSQEIQSEDQILFPNLSPENIHTLAITSRYRSLTMNKKDGKWTIAEKENYPADEQIITQVLATLSDAKVAQRTESEPSQWGRLGLLDPEVKIAENGQGYRFELRGSNNYQRTIVIGNFQASNSEASMMFGIEYDGRTFVRDPEKNEVLLLDRTLTFVNTIPSNWFQNILSNPYAYRKITYVEGAEKQWTISRKGTRETPYLLGDGPDAKTLPNLSTIIDYNFSSMFIKDAMASDFALSAGKISKERYFELEALDGFTQRIYLGGKIPVPEEERDNVTGTTGFLRKAQNSSYRYAHLEWLTERITPPPGEAPFPDRSYLIAASQLEKLMITRDELLVYERLSAPSK